LTDRDRFAQRLGDALKLLNISPAAFGAALAVDKSVVSRWLTGRTRPSAHNLTRISAEIARHRPGFSAKLFEAEDAAFAAALGLPARTPAGGDGESLFIPFGLLDIARRETARRGVEYFGHYHLYYWSFSRPGQIARMQMILEPQDGLIGVRYGASGFSFRGWALLLLNRLYMQMAEERYEAMTFLLTNPGQQPATRMLTGLLMGPSDKLNVPTVAPMLLLRVADLSGDPAADRAVHEEGAAASAFPAEGGIPAEVRGTLAALGRTVAGDGGGVALMQAPDPLV
jgi:transcriptional regulator with XRE-family HTH domain